MRRQMFSIIIVGCDDLGAPYLTIGTIFTTVGAVIGRPRPFNDNVGGH